jgi:cellulose synthase/poly-beta-1,6-N-acetylglucosamine synthase-like glycosyltransferase
MTLPLIYVCLVALVTFVYSLALLGFAQGLRNLRKNKRQAFAEWPSVSVIVPARNEAEVLERTLESLFRQQYPGAWEIVVVDDRSSDRTPRILSDLAQTSERLRVVTVTEPYPRSPKKNALAMGIRKSQGEIIVTTDADCVYDRHWLRTMISHMTPEVGIVAGPTAFDLPLEYVPLWQKIQWLDFAVQSFIGAGAIGKGVPASCNGSNLAYRRSVFEEISGYGKLSGVVSGDDVLFAQRVSQNTKWKVVFVTEPASLVHSLPVLTFKELIQQRLRWASKGLAYRGSMLAFLFGIYTYYLLLLSAPVVMFLWPHTIPAIGATLLYKLGCDHYMMRLGTKTFGLMHLRRYFLPYYFLQAIAYPYFGIGGLLLPYRWKGDWYRTARLPRGLGRTMVRFRRIMRPRRTAKSPL